MSSLDIAPHEFHALNTKALRSKAFRMLTRQQERYVLCRMNGGAVPDCRETAGLSRTGGALEHEKEHVFEAMEFFRSETRERVQVTRERMTNMLFESHAKAHEVRDEITAIREISKMHNLYLSDTEKKAPVEINVAAGGKLEILADSDLLKDSGYENLNLDPEPIDITPENAIEVIDASPTDT